MLSINRNAFYILTLFFQEKVLNIALFWILDWYYSNNHNFGIGIIIASLISKYRNLALYRHLRFSTTFIRRSHDVRAVFISFSPFSNCCTFDFMTYNWSKKYISRLLSVVDDPASLPLNWKVIQKMKRFKIKQQI